MRKLKLQIILNWKHLCNEACKCLGHVVFGFSFAAVFYSFVEWRFCWKIGIFVGIFCVSFLYGLYKVFVDTNNKVFVGTNCSLNVIYGDIWKIAESDETKIIVIPVNTTFDTIVEGAETLRPLVSENTLHGLWLKKYYPKRNDIEKLDLQIAEELENSKSKCVEKDREKGKKLFYPRGTVVRIPEDKKTCFYLLATTEFDDNNCAHATNEELIGAIISLAKEYQMGQGTTLYVPLIGTGQTREGLSYRDSLSMIVNVFRLYKHKLNGNVNVVVYSGDKDKVSIFDI